MRPHVCFVCFSEDIVEFLYVRGFIRPLPSKHLPEDGVRIKGGWVHESLWCSGQMFVVVWSVSNMFVEVSGRWAICFLKTFLEKGMFCVLRSLWNPGNLVSIEHVSIGGVGAGSEAAENFVFCWVRASLHSLQRHLLYPGLIWLLCLTTECPEGARGGRPQSGHHWGPRSHLAKEDSKGKTQITHSWETVSTAFSHLL